MDTNGRENQTMGSVRCEPARRNVATSPAGSALPLEFTRHPLTHADPGTLLTQPGAADNSTGATGPRPSAPSYSFNPTLFPTGGCGTPPTGSAAASVPPIKRCRYSTDGEAPSRARPRPCVEPAQAAGCCTGAKDGARAPLPASKPATAVRGGCGCTVGCGGGFGRRCGVRSHQGPSETQPPWTRMGPQPEPKPEPQQPLQPQQQQQRVTSSTVWWRVERTAGSCGHASSASSAPVMCRTATCEADQESPPPNGTSTTRRWPRRQGTPGCDVVQLPQQALWRPAMTPPPSSVKSCSGSSSSGGGGGAGCCRGGRRYGGSSPRQPPPLLLSLLLAATLQGLLVSGPCTAAAEWSWIVAKSRAASGAIGAAAAAATPATPGGWSFSGMLPYGWRQHGGGGAATDESISSSGSAASGHSRGSSTSRSSSSSGKVRGAGAGKASVGGSGSGGVTFRAGLVDVEVNPAGNVTALLEYDPYIPPPPSPSPPAPKGSRKPKTTRREPPDDRLLSDAQLALRELLAAPPSRRPPYDLMKPYKLPAASYKTSDFVFATGSFPARYILAQSTRSWRRGIRAFIAVNNTEDLPLLNEQNRVHNEHYSYFPDDGTGDLGPVYHGYMAGDTRAAMAPFLAHEHFGETYKWMLYGDDDTVFYMPAVKRLLAHLDPELPFAISDNLWFRARHPNLFGPRCLPCHLAVDADPEPPTPAAAAGSHHEASKPLRIPNITTVMDGYERFLLGVRSASDLDSAKVQKLLTKNTFGDFNKSLAAIAHLPPNASVPGVRYVPRPACPFCTAEAACNPTPPPAVNVSGAGCYASGGHGGAGMIFSVGLVRRLSPGRMKACYMKIIKAPGGDGMLSACMWEAGYAFTDPGASTLARYDGNYLLFSSEAGKWALHDPLTLLLRGKCDGRCKWLLRNAASHHGRGRHFQNFEQSAAYLYGNMASYTATHKWLAFMAGRDGDLAELAELAAAAGGSGGDGTESASGGTSGGSL